MKLQISCEWPFQYDDARPILDWIRSSLRHSNILSLSDFFQCEQFLREGKLLEIWSSLMIAYEHFLPGENNQDEVFGAEEGLKDIREATLACKAEAVELQRQLKQLQFQFDMLTVHASTLVQWRRARVAATSLVMDSLQPWMTAFWQEICRWTLFWEV